MGPKFLIRTRTIIEILIIYIDQELNKYCAKINIPNFFLDSVRFIKNYNL